MTVDADASPATSSSVSPYKRGPLSESMAKKPKIYWLEELLTHFDAKFPPAANDPREVCLLVVG